jgi:hypothetical protein
MQAEPHKSSSRLVLDPETYQAAFALRVYLCDDQVSLTNRLALLDMILEPFSADPKPISHHKMTSRYVVITPNNSCLSYDFSLPHFDAAENALYVKARTFYEGQYLTHKKLQYLQLPNKLTKKLVAAGIADADQYKVDKESIFQLVQAVDVSKAKKDNLGRAHMNVMEYHQTPVLIIPVRHK